MRVLGIETSCDETAAAVYDGKDGLLAHELYSQVALHATYGGVVPELASRDHLRKLLPLLEKTVEEGGGRAAIDGIAYTSGPGLVGALLVGAAVARSLAYAWDLPCIGVHHMEGHLLAPLLEPEPPQFPFVALLVSGGHTLLARVEGVGRYEILGSSLDDAAGEAFDKTAKLLGLGYPGGPQLAKLAERGRPDVFRFPRPLTERPGLDFSFSGLKTAVVVALRGRRLDEQTRADAALAFEEAVVETLGLRPYFRCLLSAENEPYGKPHPGVFLRTAAQLAVEPSRCLVFEDSFAGMVAGLAARMRVVAVPDPVHHDDPRFGAAHLKLRSLEEFGAPALERLMAGGPLIAARPAGA